MTNQSLYVFNEFDIITKSVLGSKQSVKGLGDVL